MCVLNEINKFNRKLYWIYSCYSQNRSPINLVWDKYKRSAAYHLLLKYNLFLIFLTSNVNILPHFVTFHCCLFFFPSYVVNKIHKEFIFIGTSFFKCYLSPVTCFLRSPGKRCLPLSSI